MHNIRNVKYGILKAIQVLIGHCQSKQIPTSWNFRGNIAVLKGDRAAIEFYRLITSRFSNKLGFNQPIEKAGSRKNFSTINHLHLA